MILEALQDDDDLAYRYLEASYGILGYCCLGRFSQLIKYLYPMPSVACANFAHRNIENIPGDILYMWRTVHEQYQAGIENRNPFAYRMCCCPVVPLMSNHFTKPFNAYFWCAHRRLMPAVGSRPLARWCRDWALAQPILLRSFRFLSHK
jgi:hypothetical protein